MRPVWVPVACGLVSVALFLAPVSPVRAHGALVKSSPANGTSVAQSPAVIRAWFSEGLAVKGSALRLYDARRKLLATGGVDPAVKKHDVMKLTPPHLMGSSYAVAWYAISADDGDARRGSFTFSVGTAAMPGGAMATLPPLRLVTPANNTHVKNPVTLVIETSGNINELTMGGTMSGMQGMAPHVHLHILVDDKAFMPAASQLKNVEPSRYENALPPLAAGTHTIKVFWADDSSHAPVGPVQTTRCTVAAGA